MPRCARCDAEIHDDATACATCAADAETTAPRHPIAALVPTSPLPAATAGGAVRELAIGLALTGVVAVATFGWLAMRRPDGAAVSEPASSATRPVAAAAAAPLETAGSTLGRPATAAWTDANRDRWVTRHPRHAAWEVSATRPVGVWMDAVRPLLVVRCEGRRTDVFVYTESAAAIEPQDENHSVRIAFDGKPLTQERWMDSSEHDALFAPDGRAFAERLRTTQTLRFGFTPHNAAPVTTEFDVRGFDAVAARLAKTCGWR